MKNICILVGIVLMGGIIFYNTNKGEGTLFHSEEAITEKIPEFTAEELSHTGLYEDYSPEKVAFAEKGKVLLFFKAKWCEECRAIDADILKNRTSVPENVSILKVDYDNSAELKKKYGVTIQHTFVQVDANGNLIKKWSDTFSLADALAKTQ